MVKAELEEWHKIGYKLCGIFKICHCQRKLRSIVLNLISIYDKCLEADESGEDRNFTGAEWLLIAIIDTKSDMITHGMNCEYPIINQEHEVWKWLLSIKDSPYLTDN